MGHPVHYVIVDLLFGGVLLLCNTVIGEEDNGDYFGVCSTFDSAQKIDYIVSAADFFICEHILRKNKGRGCNNLDYSSEFVFTQ